ncbi:hypothetical protein V6N13_046962 [Hibiscus sabdariffa]
MENESLGLALKVGKKQVEECKKGHIFEANWPKAYFTNHAFPTIFIATTTQRLNKYQNVAVHYTISYNSPLLNLNNLYTYFTTNFPHFLSFSPTLKQNKTIFPQIPAEEKTQTDGLHCER